MTASSSAPVVRLGFLPLLDCAVAVAAAERGFDRRHGLAIHLSREITWAALRDRLLAGALEAAHMLAGIPAALGAGHPDAPPLLAPLSLGRGGNAITLSAALVAEAPTLLDLPVSQRAAALRPLITGGAGRFRAGRSVAGESGRLRFAMVHPLSSHHYELRRWLALGGIDPDRDVEIVVFPPSKMVERLESGDIAGYCVGEPWNQVAVMAGSGVIVATKADLAPDAPEKVLALRRDWFGTAPEAAQALLDCLRETAEWCRDPAHHAALAEMLAQPGIVGVAPGLLLACLRGRPHFIAGQGAACVPDYFTPEAAPLTPTHHTRLREALAWCGQMTAAP